MSRSSQGSGEERMAHGIRGSLAESAFEDFARQEDLRYMQVGFDDPKWDDGSRVAWKIPKVYLPDFWTPEGWYECVGMKGQRCRTIKVKKQRALLKLYQTYLDDVYWFVWNSTREDWSIAHVLQMQEWLEAYLIEPKYFHDGVGYWPLTWEDLIEIGNG